MTTAIPLHTRSGQLVGRMLAGLAALGVDLNTLAQRLGMSHGALLELSPRIPLAHVNRIWDAAVALRNDDSLGLQLGTLMRAEMFEPLGLVSTASPTLGDAVIRMCRFGRLAADGLNIALDVSGERATIRMPRLPPMLEHRQGSEASVSGLGTIASQLAGMQLRALEVHFVHAEPKDTRAHVARFGVLPRFLAPHNALVFPAKLLHTPTGAHDPARVSELEQRVEALFASLPEHTSFAARVRQAVTLELPKGNAQADHIARKLGVHRRTLARHLASEHTTYRRIVDDVRQQLAQNYLETDALGLDEIALSLGFADTSAFVRAFKRWTGTTPAATRSKTRTPAA